MSDIKKCTTCSEFKDISFFGISTKSKDGYITRCKECTKNYNNLYRLNNKDELKSKRVLYDKEYYENNKEKFSEYYSMNREVILVKSQKWYEKNKEHRLEKSKEWYEENKDIKKISQEIWVNENKDKINEYRRNWAKNKRYSDPLFKITENIKGSIRKSILDKKFRKQSTTIEILGCSFDEFKVYLESKFDYWMTWENYGMYNGELNYGWDIDHIIPTSSAKDEDSIIKLNHFKNLQPLCSKINRDIKRDNIICQD